MKYGSISQTSDTKDYESPYHGQAWPQKATVCFHITDKSGYRRLRAMFPYNGQAWLHKTMNYVIKLRRNLVTKDFELCFHITDRPGYRRLRAMCLYHRQTWLRKTTVYESISQKTWPQQAYELSRAGLATEYYELCAQIRDKPG